MTHEKTVRQHIPIQLPTTSKRSKHYSGELQFEYWFVSDMTRRFDTPFWPAVRHPFLTRHFDTPFWHAVWHAFLTRRFDTPTWHAVWHAFLTRRSDTPLRHTIVAKTICVNGQATSPSFATSVRSSKLLGRVAPRNFIWQNQTRSCPSCFRRCFAGWPETGPLTVWKVLVLVWSLPKPVQSNIHLLQSMQKHIICRSGPRAVTKKSQVANFGKGSAHAEGQCCWMLILDHS